MSNNTEYQSCDTITLSRERGLFLFSPAYSRHSVLSSRSLDKNRARQDGGFMLGVMMLKRCTQCKKEKSLDEFSPDMNRSDGRRSACKECRRDPSYSVRTWIKNNSEKIKEYNHRYYLSHKEQRAIIVQNRQARENGGHITVEQWEELKQVYNYTCLRCGQQEPEIQLTMDHVMPLKLGGKHTIENIQPLCKSCNSWKHARHIDYR